MDEKLFEKRVPDKRKKIKIGDFQRMNLPRRLWKWSWERVPRELQAKVERFCKAMPEQMGEGVCLVLVGERGVGKSTLAAIIAAYARQWRFSAYYTTLEDWRENRRENAQFDDSHSVAGRMRTVDVLVIDDCFATVLASDNTYWYDQLRSLVSRRTLEGRITLVVCGYEPHNPVVKWPAGDMVRCVGLRVSGPNQHERENKDLANKLLG